MRIGGGGVMVNVSQISEHMAAYLNGCADAESFEDWIIANTWDIHLAGDSEAMTLAYKIQDLLNEYSLLHIDESVLKQKLSRTLYSIEPTKIIVVKEPLPSFPGWITTALSSAIDGTSVWDFRTRTVQA
jgi:hypothetical protein